MALGAWSSEKINKMLGRFAAEVRAWPPKIIRSVKQGIREAGRRIFIRLLSCSSQFWIEDYSQITYSQSDTSSDTDFSYSIQKPAWNQASIWLCIARLSHLGI